MGRTVSLYIPGFDIPKTAGVKYGDYAVFYDEAGNALVFDAGQRPASVALREWIKKQHFERIWAVGTHPHTDHINGIKDIINDPDIRVDKVWMTDYAALGAYTKNKYRSKPWYSRVCSMHSRCAKGLYDLCQHNGIQVGWLATGTQIRIGDIHCRVLWQSKNSYRGPDTDPLAGMFINNFSPVFLFDFGYFTAGDNELGCDAARNVCKPVIIAQIPHHGNYVDKKAFAKLKPKAAWYDYGEKNGTIGKDKGFTSWTIPVVQSQGADIWNNFRDGSIMMRFDDETAYVCGDRNDRTKCYSLGEYKNWTRSDEELAVEVMLRKHGNGDARKNALGTRWAAVQEYVKIFVSDRDALLDAMADYIIRDLCGSGEKRRAFIGEDYYSDVQKVVTRKMREKNG